MIKKTIFTVGIMLVSTSAMASGFWNVNTQTDPMTDIREGQAVTETRNGNGMVIECAAVDNKPSFSVIIYLHGQAITGDKFPVDIRFDDEQMHTFPFYVVHQHGSFLLYGEPKGQPVEGVIERLLKHDQLRFRVDGDNQHMDVIDIESGREEIKQIVEICEKEY